MKPPHMATVVIFGETLTLSGEETPERMRKVAAIADATMRAIADGRGEPYGQDNPDRSRIAVLAVLNLASRLLAAAPDSPAVSITRNYRSMVDGVREAGETGFEP